MGFGGVEELEFVRGLERVRCARGGRGELTFLSQEFHFCPPTRTLTVLSISPAEMTTPWSSLKVLYAVLIFWAAWAVVGGGMVGRG